MSRLSHPKLSRTQQPYERSHPHRSAVFVFLQRMHDGVSHVEEGWTSEGGEQGGGKGGSACVRECVFAKGVSR